MRLFSAWPHPCSFINYSYNLMKKQFIITIILLLGALQAFSQSSIYGQWKTIDDKTGEAKSIVEISEKGGKAFGKVIKIFDPNKQDAVCSECDKNDSRKDQKILGMEILRNMEKKGNEWTNGRILDPNNGSEYKCTMRLENGKLHVRGYIGFSLLGRTQIWEPVK